MQINEFIDEVLSATGADQVDLIDHSQNALLALYGPKLTDHPRRSTTIGLKSQQGLTAGESPTWAT